MDLRGYDEVQEQERHNIVLTTRPRFTAAVMVGNGAMRWMRLRT